MKLPNTSKIKTLEEASEIAKNLKAKGKKIVTTNGSFDLLHIGHVVSLETAKSYGDYLFVALNSDKSIKEYKGPKRPIIEEKYRASQLASLSCVDYIVIMDELEVAVPFVTAIKPDFHIKGSDYEGNLIEKEVVEKNNGKVIFVKREINFSTTDIIKKIKSL